MNEHITMGEVNCWKKFISSGKVEDYLTYSNYHDVSYEEEPNVRAGANPYAGINNCNRNNNETNAYRGI